MNELIVASNPLTEVTPDTLADLLLDLTRAELRGIAKAYGIPPGRSKIEAVASLIRYADRLRGRITIQIDAP